MKADYQKAFKKLISLFLPNPVPFNRKGYLKQKGPGTSQSRFRLQNEFKKNLFISYILSDQVWWYNIKWFLNYFKNYIYKFMQATSWHHKLFHFHLSFRVWKVWKGREKNPKMWISQVRKELFRWNKKHFS